MDKYIFLDRDGTIIEDAGHIYKVEDLKFLPGAIDGLRELFWHLRFKLIVVTNQAGIAKKKYDIDDFHKFDEEMRSQLQNAGVLIEKTYHCPHHPDITGECRCRKPGPGMVEQAVKDFGLNPARAIFIGDKDCDIELGQRFEARTILIDNGQYEIKSIPTARVKDLIQAAGIIKSWQNQ